jgi:hypothetical protein
MEPLSPESKSLPLMFIGLINVSFILAAAGGAFILGFAGLAISAPGERAQQTPFEMDRTFAACILIVAVFGGLAVKGVLSLNRMLYAGLLRQPQLSQATERGWKSPTILSVAAGGISGLASIAGYI